MVYYTASIRYKAQVFQKQKEIDVLKDLIKSGDVKGPYLSNGALDQQYTNFVVVVNGTICSTKKG